MARPDVESPSTTGNPCGVLSWFTASTALLSRTIFCRSVSMPLQLCLAGFGGVGWRGSGWIGLGAQPGGSQIGRLPFLHGHVWETFTSPPTSHTTSLTPSHVNVPGSTFQLEFWPPLPNSVAQPKGWAHRGSLWST